MIGWDHASNYSSGFFYRVLLKLSFTMHNMSKRQRQSPIVATPYPQGAWSEQNWIYFISGNYQVNFYPSGSRVFVREEHFKDCPYIYACTNFDFLIWSQPRGSWFKQTCIFTISGSFHINFSFSGPVVLEKIFKWNHPNFASSCLSPL